MYRKQVRRRRAVLLLLVAASLTLLSLYYREGNGGPIHGVQDVVSTVFSPIESGADRALKPVRDLVNWFGETFDARGDRSKLEDQVADLRDQLARSQTQQQRGQGALGAERDHQRRDRPRRDRPGHGAGSSAARRPSGTRP